MEDKKQLQPRLLLPLNLQFFAEDPPNDPDDPLSDPEPVPNDQQDPDPEPKPDPLSEDEYSELIRLRKEKAITAVGIKDSDDVQNALTHLEGTVDPEKMSEILRDLLDDLKIRERMSGADPSPGNGARSRYQPSDGTELGRTMYQRIKNRRKR
ncbi:hypothetical protein [Bacillus sp. AG4(2022)]|uniref:hypothetical protein n=1 Tax=Bacillus sp. AG4(2022) TaxID=2962594 RepID=UPI002881F0DD|nr:hypothetical protein [Bacillus sp. AG4(2022)]MDT0161866.1 hypothetical protein [Bacillus sp. AG4(2022)]